MDRLSITSILGLVGAMALAVSQLATASPWVKEASQIVFCMCIAGLGYYCADRKPRPPLPPGAGLLFLLLVLSRLLA